MTHFYQANYHINTVLKHRLIISFLTQVISEQYGSAGQGRVSTRLMGPNVLVFTKHLRLQTAWNTNDRRLTVTGPECHQ